MGTSVSYFFHEKNEHDVLVVVVEKKGQTNISAARSRERARFV